jgi:peptidoglycan/LPS O-acetylase OafA/YrhL
LACGLDEWILAKQFAYKQIRPMLTNHPVRTSPRVHSLTGARFIAALAVLVFHVTSIGKVPGIFQRLADFGRCGVCFFFVLSGFVMTLNYSNTFTAIRFAPLRDFLLSRFSRIVPTHVAALLVITPLCLYLNRHASLLAASSFVIPSSVALKSWLANLFLVQIYNPRVEFEQMYNAPAWSVACEVVFYLLFPFLIFLLQKQAGSVTRLGVFAGAIWIAQIVAVFSAIHYLRHHAGMIDERTFDYYVGRCPLIRIAEFAVGCCCGLIFLLHQESPATTHYSPNQWLFASLIILGVSFAGFGALPHFKYTHWSLAFTPAAGVAIIALSADGHFLQRFLQHRRMLLLGESSYALYLLQWTAILLFRQKFSANLPAWAFAGIICGCVAASVLMHLYFEVPVCRLLRRTLVRRQHPSVEPTPAKPTKNPAVCGVAQQTLPSVNPPSPAQF